MKKITIIFLAVAALFAASCASKADKPADKVVVAYVMGRGAATVNPQLMTHINYAFGKVNDTFNGISLRSPESLQEVVDLKKQNPALKVLISIGGWGAGNFSEMAATEENRNAFASDCKRIMDEFGLDGIDLDWEYPTQSSSGISSSPDDTENYTLLVKAIREAIGQEALLTMASVSSAQYVDFEATLPYFDFINIMSYDMRHDKYVHHSALYTSANTDSTSSIDLAVKAHLDAGIPKDKLVVGLAFYGRGWDGLPEYLKYGNMDQISGYEELWDEQACIPYYANEEGKLVFGFDNPRSIGVKCQYIMDNDYRGAMYWEYNCDNQTADLATTVSNIIISSPRPNLR